MTAMDPLLFLKQKTVPNVSKFLSIFVKEKFCWTANTNIKKKQ